MRVLSFDCGLKNLAYALLDVDAARQQHLVDWAVLSVEAEAEPATTRPASHDKSGFYSMSGNLFRTLASRFGPRENAAAVDVVLIENQPCMKNPTMKSVQIMVYSFFCIHFPLATVRLVSAANKLKVLRRPPGSVSTSRQLDYKGKKKLAIEIVQWYLSDSQAAVTAGLRVPDTLATVFRAAKKKDDLCDCLLQAVQWLEAETAGS